MKEKVVVTSSDYITSAVNQMQYPEENLPEVVFIGRSNVGKSSLINSLTRRRNLARVSRQPGKTQTINFFKVNLKITDNNDSIDYQKFYMVDLPGYGYAKASKDNRKFWARFIDEYLLKSPEIRFVCQLIDIRHDPMESDIKMFNWLVDNNLPVLIVATKSDKVSTTAKKKQIGVIKKNLGVPTLSVLPYSSIKSEGRSELLDVIVDSLIK